MRIIGIVPARGGSERLPGKNMRLLAGEHLLTWTLAVAAKACDLVVVTSDDLDILQHAHHFPKIICVERSKLLAHPRVPDLPVVTHAYRSGIPDQQPDDVIVYLRPTAPFRTAREIRDVVSLIGGHLACDSVRSVVRSREHPAKSYREAGWTQEMNNGPRWPILEPWARDWHRPNHPRQILPESWRACGFIDAVRGDVIRGGSMEGDCILGWPAPVERAIDIDDADDLAQAEALALRKGWTPGDVG